MCQWAAVEWIRRVSAPVLVCAVVVAAAPIVQADVAYNVVNLGSFGGQTVPNDINNDGYVVGSSMDTSLGQQRAFLFQDGALIDLGSFYDRNQHNAFGINDSGTIVGFANHQTWGMSAVYTDAAGGDWNMIHSGYNDGMARGINEQGHVIGHHTPTGSNNYTAFVHVAPWEGSYSPSSVAFLGPLPGDVRSQAQDINDSWYGSPVVVGSSISSSGAQHAFVWNEDHGVLDLHSVIVPDAYGIAFDNVLWTNAVAVSDRNTIVGNIGFVDESIPGDPRTYVLGFQYAVHGDIQVDESGLPTGGYFSALQGPGTGTFVSDVNTDGDIVGSYLSDGEASRAMIYAPSSFGGLPVDLNDYVAMPDGWWLSTAEGINDHGQIIARASDGAIEYGQTVSNHAMLLTPIGLPSSPVGSGEQVTIRLSGGAEGGPGGVTFDFTNVDAGGTLEANHFYVDYSFFPDAPFALPNSDHGEAWDIHFDGSFMDGVVLTFAYDPDLLPLGFDPELLRIYHFEEDAGWVLLESQVVDMVNHTITGTTYSFSPFVLAIVPEPISGALLLVAGVAFLLRRQRAV